MSYLLGYLSLFPAMIFGDKNEYKQLWIYIIGLNCFQHYTRGVSVIHPQSFCSKELIAAEPIIHYVEPMVYKHNRLNIGILAYSIPKRMVILYYHALFT